MEFAVTHQTGKELEPQKLLAAKERRERKRSDRIYRIERAFPNPNGIAIIVGALMATTPLG
jgi:hypothetical protein